MWVARTEYLELERRAAASAATTDWMRVRINQLERENAMLKGKVLGIPVEAPEIRVESAAVASTTPVARSGQHRTPTPERESPSVQDIFAGNIGFEDMGDEEAHRQGVNWDTHTGLPVYR
jgi:hypothetical protein